MKFRICTNNEYDGFWIEGNVSDDFKSNMNSAATLHPTLSYHFSTQEEAEDAIIEYYKLRSSGMQIVKDFREITPNGAERGTIYLMVTDENGTTYPEIKI